MGCPTKNAGVEACIAAIGQPSRLARDGLNNHGFSVVFDEDACGFQSISGMLSNTSSGPTPREVMDREGTVLCFLLVRPRNDPAVPEVEGDTGAAHAERRLENLSCDLYASRAPVEDEAARLETLSQRCGRPFADANPWCPELGARRPSCELNATTP